MYECGTAGIMLCIATGAVVLTSMSSFIAAGAAEKQAQERSRKTAEAACLLTPATGQVRGTRPRWGLQGAHH